MAQAHTSQRVLANDMLYFFDTSSTWRSVVEVEGDSVEKMERAFAHVLEQTPEELARLFSYATRSGKAADQVSKLIEVACAYLSTAECSEDAYKSPAGNIWFLIGYRLYDGDYVVRPARTCRHSTASYIPDILRNIVYHDLSVGPEQHPIRQILRKGGGAIVNPSSFLL
jgi:hypothetical protein